MRLRPLSVGLLIALIAPALLFLAFRVGTQLSPQADPLLLSPLFHFYAASFIGLMIGVTSWLLALVSERLLSMRVFWLVLGYALLANFYFIRGVATPGALLPDDSLAFIWATRLGHLSGGLGLLLAGFPWREAQIEWQRRYHRLLYALPLIGSIACGFFLVLLPQLFDFMSLSQPWLPALLSWAAAAILTVAAWQAFRLMEQGAQRDEGILLLLGAILLLQSVAIEAYGLQWHLSWWLSHLPVPIAFGITLAALVKRYAPLRQFRLLPYYAIASSFLIGVLTIVASEVIYNRASAILLEEATTNAIGLADNLAMVLPQRIPDFPATEAPLDGGERQARAFMLTREIPTTSNVSVVNVVNERGQITFSTDWTLIGRPVEDRSFFEGVQQNQRQTRLRLQPTAAQGYESPAQALVGVPIYADPYERDTIVGVLELTLDTSETQARAAALRWQVLGSSAAMMFVLFLGLLLVISQANRLLKERTQALEEAVVAAKRAEQARMDLTRMIVHDLQNPLSAIMGNLELLGDSLAGRVNSIQEERLAHMRHASDAMMGLITDMLNMARLEAGALTPRREEVYLTSLFQDVTRLFDGSLNGDGPTRHLVVAPHLPPALGDRDLLFRVLCNLVNNALKYTSDEGQITIEAQVEPREGLVIAVHDNGIGIPESDLPYIFDRFRQGSSARRGHGLGLTFCHMAIEAQGGRIWAKSVQGEGTSIFFTLPAAADQEF